MRWIKHNFATVLAVCLVIVFGVMAVVLPDSIDAQAVTPEAPNVTLTDNGDGTYDISGTDDTMEYNTVSETHTIWKACTGDSDEFTGLTNAAVYYFRVKATETAEAGAVKTVFYGISAPTLNSVQNTGEKKNTVRIENLTEEMEYNTEGPLATTWTKLTAEKIQELQEISETGIYYIRTAAKEADGENPAAKVSLPCRVVILIPKFNYIENGTYNITGLSERFEYKKSTEETWIKYTTSELVGVGESATYNFRVIATADEAAGQIQSVDVKVKPAAPTLSISHNEDGTTVKINGVDETMEYTTDPNAEPTVYVAGALDRITKPLDETFFYYVRLKATDTAQAGFYATVEIPLQERPAAPELTITDNEDETVTVTSTNPTDVPLTTVEYNTISADAADSEWITCDNADFVISTGGVYYFRVKANGGIPAGNVTRAMILILKDNGDHTVRIDGIDDTMEYRKNEETTWTPCTDGALDRITESGTYYVRIQGETEPVSRFDITITVISQPAAPDLMLTINGDETATVTSTLAFNTLEYNTNSATAEDGDWTACTGENLVVADGGIYYFRVKAVGETPASAVTTAIILIPKVTADRKVRIDGMDSTMQYTKDVSGTWTPYVTGCETDNITETSTYYVRIGEETEYVTVTIRIATQPAAPELTLQSNSNETVTIASKEPATIPFATLEYNTNSATAEDGDWTSCTGENLVVANGGVYYFRVKAVGETPAGAVTTALILIQKENGDNTVRIDGMNETMWYTKDVAGTWTQYTSGCEMDNISETSTYYVKLSETSENYTTVIVTFSTTPEVPKYAVTFEETDKGTLSGSGEYEEGATVTITAIVNSGYSFNDWEVVSGEVTIADATLAETTFTMGTTPVSIKATFTANTYTITLEGQTQEVTFGQPYGELPTPTQEGFIFGGWYLEPEYTTKVESTTTVTTASNHTLYARWTATPLYAVTVSNETSERGSVSGSGEYEEGDTVTITATANEGYTFSSWEVVSGEVTLADATATEITFTMVGTEVSIKANFIANTYTITLGEGGEERAVTYGQPYGELPTPTQEGSVFAGWYLEPEYTTKIESTTTVTTASDHTLYARWTTTEAPKYTVTVSNETSERGTVSGSGEYEEGDIVMITATANEGYTFSGWEVVSGEVTLTDATAAETTFTMVATPISIKANFTANTYTITLEGQTQEVTFGQPYGELPTPTQEGSVFGGWYLEPEFTTRVESTTIVTTASNHTLYAKWNLAGVEDATIAFVWDTTNQLTKTITVETGAATKIDWGDGMVERIPASSTALELSHTYATEGAYTVKIEDDIILYLDCSGMKLNTLNVIKNTKLTVLICSDNQLERLDVSENTELVTLDCSNNKLEKLDISENTALKNLYCGGNQLETLNIKNNTKLVRVCCVQETLKKVYVTATQNDKMTIKNVTSYCNDITSSNIIHKHKNTSVVGTSSSGSSSGGSSSSGGGGSVTYPTGSISSSSWKNKFTDVTTEDWYYEAIKYVNKKNYFSGTTTTTFSPNDPMSREMIVTVLYNMEKRPITYGPNNYWDVPSGSWSEPAIVWASKYGIVSGYPQGNFAPAQPITREELATILKKYSEYKKANLYKYDYGTVEAFVDKGTISDWAVGSMVWATSNDLMKGTYGYLLPQKSATRAEVAAMIMNYCEK